MKYKWLRGYGYWLFAVSYFFVAMALLKFSPTTSLGFVVLGGLNLIYALSRSRGYGKHARWVWVLTTLNFVGVVAVLILGVLIWNFIRGTMVLGR